jgi:SH3-like domain-containing protein
MSFGLSTLGAVVAILIVACCCAARASEPAPGKPVSPPKVSSRAGAGSSGDRLLCVNPEHRGQGLPVRSGPGLDKPVTGQFKADECGIGLVGACRGDWCEMALGGVRGWVDTRFIGVYELPRSSAPKQDAAAVAPTPGGQRRQQPTSALPAPSSASAARPEQSVRQLPGAPRTHAGERQSWEARRVESGRHRRVISACVARVAWWDTLRIRSGPGVGNDEIGGIPPRACSIERVGGCRGAWCRVAWRGRFGWVNTYYLE